MEENLVADTRCKPNAEPSRTCRRSLFSLRMAASTKAWRSTASPTKLKLPCGTQIGTRCSLVGESHRQEHYAVCVGRLDAA